jgi:21S rRNA (GM2251-2'-O)-methyltransferase
MYSSKFITKPNGNLLVVLDQIVDPQNLGSIVRSAVFLGADGILVNKRNKPPISSSVCKVSSGATECVEMFAVKSLKSFLESAIKKSWTVITTTLEKEHDVQIRPSPQPSEGEKDDEVSDPASDQLQFQVESKNIPLNELTLSKENNVIVVLGSEANGVNLNLTNVSNFNIFIPPVLNKELVNKPPFNVIDSLNVGVSAGVIINHIKSQLKKESNWEKNNNNTTENKNINTVSESISLASEGEIKINLH